MKKKTHNETITKLFDDVRDSLQSAKLIAFDGKTPS